MPDADATHSAFFYGTLMAPAVLGRVIRRSTAPPDPPTWRACPAILPDHRRYRVKAQDYPAMLPHPGSRVRGTYVTGLTADDIGRLDIFEGSEYARERVKCRLLDGGAAEPVGEEVDAETYIWIAGEDGLDGREWDFDEFRREKMQFWVGGAESEEEDDDAGVACMNGSYRPR